MNHQQGQSDNMPTTTQHPQLAPPTPPPPPPLPPISLAAPSSLASQHSPPHPHAQTPTLTSSPSKPHYHTPHHTHYHASPHGPPPPPPPPPSSTTTDSPTAIAHLPSPHYPRTHNPHSPHALTHHAHHTHYSHHSHHSHHSHSPNVDAVLPRGTLVRIIGNNRTKSELHGRTGYVCTAQTLGGWHEVELVDDGKDMDNKKISKSMKNKGKRLVKVQRNALEVLKLGEGGIVTEGGSGRKKEKEGDKIGGSGGSGGGCSGAVGNSHSGGNGSIVGMNMGRRNGRKNNYNYGIGRKIEKNIGGGGGSSNNGGKVVRAKIEKLDQKSLNKYRKFYGLKFSEKEPSREELVWAVKRHFDKQKVNEVEVIRNFLRRIYKGSASTRME